MVGKRNNKTEEVDEEYFKFLKQNNKFLAKALTNERLKNKATLEEKTMLQRKLQSSALLNMRYKNIMNQLLSQCKDALPTCVSFSDSIVQMMKLSSDGVNLSQNVDPLDSSFLSANQRASSPYVVNKTHAVKPMVSGHVIARPTISLFRLSDTEHAELSRNLESQSVDLRVEEISSSQNATQNTEPVPYNTTSQNRINFSTRRRPVRILPEDIYDVDDIEEADEGISSPAPNRMVNGDSVSPETSPIQNGRPSNLTPVVEVSEESSSESEGNAVVLREARIVLDTLPDVPIKKTKKDRRPIRVQEDPLEGPSTLLDNFGRVTNSRYFSRSRAASRTPFTIPHKEPLSDSDSSNEDNSLINRPKILKKRSKAKRKGGDFKSHSTSPNAESTLETNNKPSKKKPKVDVPVATEINRIDAQHSQPIVVLTPLNDIYQSGSEPSTPTSTLNTNSTETFRSQRISSRIRGNYNLKELSLKCKLRRDK